MDKKLIFISIIIYIIFLMNTYSCDTQKKYHSGGPYYYGGFVSYKIPFRPIEELTQDEAKSRDVYYVAYFNDDGKIASFTKYIRGQVEFSDKYIYEEDGTLKRREMTKSNGDVIIQYFDKNGRIIKNK